jgi:anti-anti-sigma regulatory factor
MVQSLHLLGSKIVVTGISAAVAMTMTEIGIDLQEVEIANSPQDVLQEHMTRKRTL